MDKNKIRACPFCHKNVAEICSSRELEGVDEPSQEYAVCCSFLRGGCGATSGYAQTEEAAVAKWNNRAGGHNKYYLDTERNVFLTEAQLRDEFEHSGDNESSETFEEFIANATSSQGFLERLEKAVRVLKSFNTGFVICADCISESNLSVAEKFELYGLVGELYGGYDD